MPPNSPAVSSPLLKAVYWLYLLGMLFVSSLLYSTKVLDNTLMPRLLGAMVVLSLCSGLLIVSRSRWHTPRLTWPLALLVVYLLWQCSGLLWAATFTECLLECQRVFLSLGVFVLTVIILENVPRFRQDLMRVALVLGLVAIALAFYQLFQIQGINKLSLYEVKGPSGHRNLFGALLLILMACSGMAWSKLDQLWKKLAVLVATLSLLVILLLQARSAWMGLLLGGFTMLLLRWQKTRNMNWA